MGENLGNMTVEYTTEERIQNFYNNSDSEIILEKPKENPIKRELLKKLNELVIGQDEAKEYISTSLANVFGEIRPKKGPIGVFFFAGPTGTGKTYIGQALAKILLGNEDYITKINLDEYHDDFTVTKLLGAPPGYKGHGNPTPLTSNNVYQPYNTAKEEKTTHRLVNKLDNFSIIVFDEAEKGHPDILQSLLGMLHDGKLSFDIGDKENSRAKFDSVTNFSNSIIILTSNIGAREAYKNSIGFVDVSNSERNIAFKNAYNNHFSPEFRNRIDNNITVFQDLSNDDCFKIINLELKDYEVNLNSPDKWDGLLKLDVEDYVLEYILNKGYSKERGVRDLKRVFRNIFDSQVNEYINNDPIIGHNIEANKNLVIKISMGENGNFIFKLGHNNDAGKEKIERLEDNTKNEVSQLIRFNIQKGSCMEYVGDMTSLQIQYVKLYANREIDGINFEDEMESVSQELMDKGYTKEEIITLEKYSTWTIIKNFDYINQFEGIIYPDDIFPVLTTSFVKKIIEKTIKTYLGESQIGSKGLRNDINLIKHIEIILEKVMGRKLNKKQVNIFLFLINKYYIEHGLHI